MFHIFIIKHIYGGLHTADGHVYLTYSFLGDFVIFFLCGICVKP